MASGKILRQLIRYGAEGNLDAFRVVSEEVIKEEREKQHHLLANDLEKILYGRTAQPVAFRKLQEAIPTDNLPFALSNITIPNLEAIHKRHPIQVDLKFPVESQIMLSTNASTVYQQHLG